MLKKNIYSLFAKFYTPYQSHLILKFIAYLLQRIFGLAVFNYGGVKLTAGPLSYLDHFIICGHNINPYVTSALSQYFTEEGVFLDIGANHGVLSLLASRNPKIKIFAFEPSARELQRFWKNLQLNPNNKINVLSYGISENEKKQSLILAGLDNPGKNSIPEILFEGTMVDCNFSSLDKLLSRNILEQTRLCKLDVEGQEMFILNGMRQYMDLFKQCVFIIEISPRFLSRVGSQAKDIYQFFSEIGFTYQFGIQENSFQWEEVFYHPDYSLELIFSEKI